MLSLQPCPRCRRNVPFSVATVGRSGSEQYACPGCGAQLHRKSDSRVLTGTLVGAVLAAPLALLPWFLAVPALAAIVFWGVRWTLELEAVPS